MMAAVKDIFRQLKPYWELVEKSENSQYVVRCKLLFYILSVTTESPHSQMMNWTG